MICKSDITNIKEDIGDKIGKKIIVKGSLGRSKSFEKEATIEKTYPNIFLVKYEENNRTVSYNYTDVLTRTVELDVFDGEKYNPLLPPVVEEQKKVKQVMELINSSNSSMLVIFKPSTPSKIFLLSFTLILRFKSLTPFHISLKLSILFV